MQKLNAEVKLYDYKKRFNLTSALEKNNQSHRKARNYLRLQQLALHQKSVVDAEDKLRNTLDELDKKRKVRLASTLGRPTLKNPVEDLVKGFSRIYTDEEIAQRLLLRHITQKRVELDTRRLKSLPEFMGSNLFLQLGQPKSMSAVRNELTHIYNRHAPAITVRQFRSLTTLNLAGNKLTVLPPDIGLLSNLKVLNLESNKLTILPPSISQLNRLTHLHLKLNNLTTLPDHIGDLTALQHLDLANNLLNELCGTFGGLVSLTFLDLTENKLSHLAIIPSTRWKLWGKRCPLDWEEYHSLDTNRSKWVNRVTASMINARPSELKSLEEQPIPTTTNVKVSAARRAARHEEEVRRKKLTELARRNEREWSTPTDIETGFVMFQNNLTGEVFTTIPPELDSFGRLIHLKVLRLTGNMLKALPDSLGGMTDLEVLDARQNYLTKFPGCLKKWTKLRILMLNENDLTELPNLFDRLTNLEEFHASRNVLQCLPETLGSCTKLKKLMVGVNQITHLPYTLGYLEDIQEMQVFDNPISDPPSAALTLPRDELLWVLREKHKECLLGHPPTVEAHMEGVANEVLLLEQEFLKEVQEMLAPAKKRVTTIDLHLRGEYAWCSLPKMLYLD